MGNTYTIQGLKVPEIEAEIAKVREELSSLRTLFNAAVEAITRLDADVAALAAGSAASTDPEWYPDPLIVGIRQLRAIEIAAHRWASAVEESEDNDEESEQYLDASHGLFVALGRTKPTTS